MQIEIGNRRPLFWLLAGAAVIGVIWWLGQNDEDGLQNDGDEVLE